MHCQAACTICSNTSTHTVPQHAHLGSHTAAQPNNIHTPGLAPAALRCLPPAAAGCWLPAALPVALAAVAGVAVDLPADVNRLRPPAGALLRTCTRTGYTGYVQGTASSDDCTDAVFLSEHRLSCDRC